MTEQDAYTKAGVSQAGAGSAVAALVRSLKLIDTGKESRVVPLPGHYASVLRIDERTGRATGVHYVSQGRERFQRAAMVAVAGYSIETPRLLLNSASRRFPAGLCNDFDQVGRYLMVQGAPQTAGRFDAEVRMYKAPPPEVSTEEFYETDPARGAKRGF